MTTRDQRYLGFTIGDEEFAVPLLLVKEVIAMPVFTKVPHAPAHCLGVMNLRGQVISGFDLRLKLSGKATVKGLETAVIILNLGALAFGVVVDSVNAVLSPRPEDLSPAPELDGRHGASFVTGIYRREQRLTLLLDIAKTLSLTEQAFVTAAAGGAHAA